jgi:hypothetical protein
VVVNCLLQRGAIVGLLIWTVAALGCSKATEKSAPSATAETNSSAAPAQGGGEIALASASIPIGPPPSKPSALPPDDATATTVEQLHENIRRANPNYNGLGQFRIQNGQVLAMSLRGSAVSDLSPIAGLPLFALDVTGTPVADLSPLSGMQLRHLFIGGTQVQDISPLSGMPLETLDVMETPVADLAPLRGMPLQQLFIEGAPLNDLSILAGMPLKALYLSRSPIADIRPLAGMKLEQLSLAGTQVRDLSPLAGMPLTMLWLSDTPVSDISALRDCPLMSLTMKGVQVTDLSPMATMTNLRRLHIAETPATDLTPLAGLHLTQLVFTPGRITRGMEMVRQMGTLQEIGTVFEDPENSNLVPAAKFWEQLDAGQIQ